MKDYQNFLNSYVVQANFNMLDEYDKPLTLKKDTVLEAYANEHEYPEPKEKYFYLPQGGSILINMNLVREYMKKEFDIYQEQFSHLNKNHLYFGQIDHNNDFTIKNENGIKIYTKIGEYITSDGKKYNAVEINKDHMYWEHDNKESHEKTTPVYFENDTLIVENYKFSYKEHKTFFPTLSLEVCEEFTEFPQMLEILDCFFRKESLTLEQEYVYEEYHRYIDNKELLGCGFYSPQNKSIEEVKEDIQYNHRHIRRYF